MIEIESIATEVALLVDHAVTVQVADGEHRRPVLCGAAHGASHRWH
ncbi:hypothetical protein ACTU6U_10735 [Microbacterium sp. A196]